MAGIVVVFDFDKTIIDCDSDNWVADELGFTPRLDQLLHTLPWNAMMDKLMEEIRSSGIGIGRIAEVLRRMPIHPRVVPAIKAAHAFGCDMRIVSDANTFFIDTILKHLGIKGLFSEIHTNLGFVDGQGRLRISPYHDYGTCPHGCGLCPPNMCKGLIVRRMQAAAGSADQENRKRFVYVGDGAGDYCPTLGLGESDFVMPRKDFPLWDLMSKNASQIKAEVQEWTDGQEQETALLGIVQRIIREEKDQLSVANCKLQEIAGGAAHEAALRQALPVPH